MGGIYDQIEQGAPPGSDAGQSVNGVGGGSIK